MGNFGRFWPILPHFTRFMPSIRPSSIFRCQYISDRLFLWSFFVLLHPIFGRFGRIFAISAHFLSVISSYAISMPFYPSFLVSSKSEIRHTIWLIFRYFSQFFAIFATSAILTFFGCFRPFFGRISAGTAERRKRRTVYKEFRYLSITLNTKKLFSVMLL